MPRPVWKGAISFGLVNVPVALYAAESRDALRFRPTRPYHAHARARASHQRAVGPGSGVDRHREGLRVLARPLRRPHRRGARRRGRARRAHDRHPGLRLRGGDSTRATTTDRTTSPPRPVARRATRCFARRCDAADAWPWPRSYPHQGVPRRRRAGRAVLLLELLRYPHELRDAAELEIPGEDLAELGVKDREVALADQLVAAMVEPWSPEQYRDAHRDAVLELVQRKIAAGREHETL